MLSEADRQARDDAIEKALEQSGGDLNAALNEIKRQRRANNGANQNDPALVNADHYLVAAILTDQYGPTIAAAAVFGYETIKACGIEEAGRQVDELLARLSPRFHPRRRAPASPPSMDSIQSGLDGIRSRIRSRPVFPLPPEFWYPGFPPSA
jgi:hypothetical protein